jgi:hypothetical protein
MEREDKKAVYEDEAKTDEGDEEILYAAQPKLLRSNDFNLKHSLINHPVTWKLPPSAIILEDTYLGEMPLLNGPWTSSDEKGQLEEKTDCQLLPFPREEEETQDKEEKKSDAKDLDSPFEEDEKERKHEAKEEQKSESKQSRYSFDSNAK